MSAALLPCPFCSGPVQLEKTHKNRHEIYGERQWWGVRCTNTVNVGGTCAIEAIPTASPEAAIERWNRRAPAIAPPVAAGSVDTGELRRLALDATRGPWRHTRHGVVVAGPFRQYTNGSAQSQIASFCVTSHEEDGEHQTEKQVPNALFSAAARPDVVLALIERAEKAEAELEDWIHTNRIDELQRSLVAAEARVKELEAAYQEVLRRCL